MHRPKSWSDRQLRTAVSDSTSIAQVIKKLGLVPAGGNYIQVKKRIEELKLNTKHFTGHGWSKGLRGRYLPHTQLKDILVQGSGFQSHKLKIRLFKEGLKKPICEKCGWCEKSEDGRVPIELDHINGDRFDNRIENLRILCPNCHSLQPTHRGKNSLKHKARVA